MYIQTKTVTSYGSKQIAYLVGKDQDSYNIDSFFIEDLETGKIESEHRLIKNPHHQVYNPKYKYKEGTRFKEQLHIGSYKECVAIVQAIVEQEGEWERDEKGQWVHQI